MSNPRCYTHGHSKGATKNRSAFFVLQNKPFNQNNFEEE